MKFEFDHRTGTMQPKKDDQIYFAKSQGGGLIVDDKKFNIKYIIERDERITKLFGSFDKNRLNFYDMRDARMISDRVIRLFGRNHKYTDYHYFLKGYHMNENYVQKIEDFLGESVWTDIQKRSNGEIRKEDGMKIGVLEDGTTLVIGSDAFEDGNIVDFDGSYLYTFENGISVAIISDGNTDAYYSYDPELDEEKYNMRRCFDADSILRTDHEFKPLIAFMKDVDNNDDGWDNDNFYDMTVDVRSKWIDFSTSQWNKWRLFFDRDDAIGYAIDSEESLFDETDFSQPYTYGSEESCIKHYYDLFGTDWFDKDWFKDTLQESYEYYYDEMSEEDVIEELLRMKIIEDTEEYFDLDEDGEIDHTLPKFDVQDYKDQYVEKRMGDIDDYVKEYISQYGEEEIKNHINTRRLAELCIEKYGPGPTIAGYDSVEREEEVDGTTYYIYRTE